MQEEKIILQDTRTRIVSKWRMFDSSMQIRNYNLQCRIIFFEEKMENVLFQYTSWQILLLKTREHSWQKMEPPTSKHVRHILNLKMEGYFQYKYATKETHKQKHSLQVQKHLQLSSFCVVAIRRI